MIVTLYALGCWCKASYLSISRQVLFIDLLIAGRYILHHLWLCNHRFVWNCPYGWAEMCRVRMTFASKVKRVCVCVCVCVCESVLIFICAILQITHKTLGNCTLAGRCVRCHSRGLPEDLVFVLTFICTILQITHEAIKLYVSRCVRRYPHGLPEDLVFWCGHWQRGE